MDDISHNAVNGLKKETSLKTQERVAWLIALLSFVGITVASVYSWMMTSTGFLVTNILPIDITLPFGVVFTGKSMAYILSGLMQSAIFSFYLYLPYISFRTALPQIILAIFVIIFIAISLTFSLFSLHFTANAEKYYGSNQLQLLGIFQTINALDEAITNTYNNHIISLESLAEDSASGRDESRVAKCGTLCKGYFQEKRRLQTAYQGSLSSNHPINIETNADINDSWIALLSAQEGINRKNIQFEFFVIDARIGHNFSQTIINIDSEITTLANTRFNTGKILGKSDIVLTMVNKQIHDVLEDVNGLTGTDMLVFLIALLPDLLSTAFVLLIYTSRRKGVVNAGLKDEFKDIKERIKLKTKINKEYEKEWGQDLKSTLHKRKR